MDTLTHALVGAAISDGWFRRRLGPVATPFALVVSALPDADIVAYFISPEYAWATHRGYSHSFFTFLLAAPLLGYAGYRISAREGRIRLWMLLAFLCLVSHTIGDLVTSWGTMPLLPFSNARLSWDILPIIDVFVTSLAALSFLLNRFLRWERVETFLNPVAFPVTHKHPRRQRAANVIAVATVLLIVAYTLVGWRQNRQAVRLAWRELAATGVEPVEVRALPVMFTYIAYGIAARDAAGTVYNATFSSLAPKPLLFDYHPTVSGPAIDAAKNTPEGGMFIWYSQGMYVADVEDAVGGVTVRFRDRRFFPPSRPRQSRFVMEFSEDSEGRVLDARLMRTGPAGMDPRADLRALWNLTRYGETDPGE